MKKLLAVVMAVACATAVATDYTWTGGGAAGSWKDPANWGGGGYPHLQGDTATVAVNADITVDETVTITALNATSGAKVTVRDNGTAELHFMPVADSKTAGPTATGTGTELTLLAKVVNDKSVPSGYDRSDPSVSGGGVLRFGGTWTNGTMTAIVYLNGTDGAYDFRGGDFYTPKNLTLGWKSGAGNQSKTINMAIGEGAVVVVPQTFLMGGNAQTPNTYVEQEDGSRFSPNYFNMGSASSYSAGWNTTNIFVKKGGLLTGCNTLTLGNKLSGFFIQEAGTTEVSTVSFPVVSNAYSRLDVTGGTFSFVKLNADLISGTAMDKLTETKLDNPQNVDISFSNCTIRNGGAYHNFIAHPVRLDGDIVFDATSGKTTAFSNPVIGDDFNPTMTEKAAVELTMTRDFTQTKGAPRYNVFTVASGCTYTLAGGTFEASDLVLADPTAVFEVDGGTLAFTANASPSGVFRINGMATVDVAAGKTVTLNVELGREGKIVQTGGGALNLVYCGNSYLTDGEYSFGTLAVGATKSTTLTIAGANVTADKLSFGSGVKALVHGKIVLESGSLKFGVIAGDTVEPGEIELKGGTLKFDATVNLSAAVRISGATTIEVESGKTLTFLTPPTFTDDAKVVKTGAGTVAFAANTTALWRGDFDIDEGVVQLMKWATLKHDPASSSATHAIAIKDKGRFIIGERYNLAQVAAWVDYVITDGGCVVGYERNTIPVNSITVDGTAQAVGAYSGTDFSGTAYEDVAGWFRQNGGNYNSALVIPYRWTGAGDGVTWENEANWANNTKPIAAASGVYSFADLSAADHVTFADALTITGVFFMPSDGRRKLVIDGPGTKRFSFYSSVNYSIGSFVAPDCELVFRNCRPYKSNGTQIVRSFGGQVTFEGSANFTDPIMGGIPYFGTAAVVQFATNSSPAQVYSFAGYAGQYSTVWFDQGTKLEFSRIYTALNSIPCIWELGVRNGGDLTLTDLYISRTSGDNLPMFTVRDDASKLTLTEGLYLGTRCPTVSGNRLQDGGSFTLESGTVTTPKIANELDNNYFYLKGGELRLGAVGITNSTSRVDKQVSGDSTTYQTTPAFYFQGGTLTATDAFDDVLVTELTTGTESVLDTDEFDVTFRGNLVGAGALVKRGTGVMTLDCALEDAATLKIEEGTLRLGGNFSQGEKLVQLSAPSTDAIALAADQNLTVGVFLVNGEAKFGTVPCGEGTVTVIPDVAYDWLMAAQTTANYTKTFDADATLGSFDYKNYVSDAGVLTIAGAADAKLTLSAGTTISVAPGDTLVFDLPVCLAGTLTITGGGEVKFTENAPVTIVPESASATVRGGTWLTVCAAWTRDCSLWLVSAAADARLCRLTVDGAGSVNQSPLPTNGSSNGTGTGGEMVLSNGGTFRLRNTDGVFGSATVQTQRLILVDGGVLILPGTLRRYPKAGASTLEILDYGGVLTTDNYAVSPILADDITVELHGEAMEIRPTTKPPLTVNAVAANFTGIGAIVQKTAGKTLYLSGDLSGVTNLSVEAGGLVLQNTAVDTLSQSDVSLDRAAATLSIAGTATINGLYLDGVQARQGLYGKGVAPKAKFLAPIESGFLDVKDGLPPGTLIIVR